jgi:hypothetical protein
MSAFVTMELPWDAPAGVIVVEGRHWVNIDHTAGTDDKGFLTYSMTPGDCGFAYLDFDRTYFKIPAAMPTVNGISAYEIAVPTRQEFSIPAGGGTFRIYLNGMMESGLGGFDGEGRELIHAQFHPRP